MQNPVPDERYSVADEAILGAFFKLLKKKTPDQITVSDITKTAGIARSTFYNHYQDIPSLVSAVEEKTIQDVFSEIIISYSGNDCRAVSKPCSCTDKNSRCSTWERSSEIFPGFI